jgi:protein TonB
MSASVGAHALILLLLLSLPTCRRQAPPEHKIYTFDLIDPSQLTMKKQEAKAPVKIKKKPKKKAKKKRTKKKKRAIKKTAALPKEKESIEDKIKKKLEEIDKKEWKEPEDKEELEKAKLIDTGTFQNAWYSDIVASKIYQHWNTPSKALLDLPDPAVVVRFVIARNGGVRIIRIDKKSGSELLDRSAVQAIENAQPLPPLPADYSGESLEVCMTFIPEE